MINVTSEVKNYSHYNKTTWIKECIFGGCLLNNRLKENIVYIYYKLCYLSQPGKSQEKLEPLQQNTLQNRTWPSVCN